MTSFDDCAALTSSLGCTGRPASSVGARRDHLVGVHVGRRAGSGLEDVDGELVVPTPGGDLVGRGRDRGRQLGVEVREVDARRIDARRGRLHEAECVDERTRHPAPGDLEVVDRPLGLRAVPRLGRNVDLPQRVVLTSCSRHRITMTRSTGVRPPAGGVDLAPHRLLPIGAGDTPVAPQRADEPETPSSRCPRPRPTVAASATPRAQVGDLDAHAESRRVEAAAQPDAGARMDHRVGDQLGDDEADALDQRLVDSRSPPTAR